ncbi:MAG: nucleotidyl transferase AbiEii/AbiGii toxin family protein [Proteobacteria bacterium]|nr:nucleotidyl transferase AbiEii/AbiGii toxin family protein [Pseudomonadota bacterium]MBU1716822.1 nucleotidyl transferase AbiEii/AbiGii toxin family protein [Pseudomonadota bacterium]
MLQLKAVHKGTFDLLTSLVSQGDLSEFSLAGGTALALRLGHRLSVDLDFFTRRPFDSGELFELLRELYEVSSCSHSANTLSLFMKSQEEKVKVDFLRHNYSLLRPVSTIDQVQIFSLEDIAAMKLNAIANRGAKKDFYDIHALLDLYSLQDLLGFFEQKYNQLNSFTVVKSLVYFADADLEPEPLSMLDISWDQIKKDLKDLVRAM